MKHKFTMVAAVLAVCAVATLIGYHPSPETMALGPSLAMVGMINVAAGEKLAVLGVVDPATVANSEVFTDVIDLKSFHQVLGVALLGNMANETIDFKCYYCDSDGGNAAAVKSAAQLAASASANDNSQIVISIRSDDLITAGKQYIKFGLVTGNSTGGPAAVLALGVDARFGPANASNLASVKEVKI